MKNLKIFPKMFLQTFSILSTLIILIHLFVFFVFPQTYLETRKEEIYSKANEISNNIQGKDMKFVEQFLDFYSKISEIKVFVKGRDGNNEVQIGNNINIDLTSGNNSLIIASSFFMNFIALSGSTLPSFVFILLNTEPSSELKVAHKYEP